MSTVECSEMVGSSGLHNGPVDVGLLQSIRGNTLLLISSGSRIVKN